MLLHNLSWWSSATGYDYRGSVVVGTGGMNDRTSWNGLKHKHIYMLRVKSIRHLLMNSGIMYVTHLLV